MIKRFLFWQTVVLVILLFTGFAAAEIKTYTHTVKQPFGGSQSPDDARTAALTKAKREVLQMAGTYLETLTIVQENVVEKDDILALAAGVLKAEIVSQKNYLTGDAFGIIVHAKVDVDTSILGARIKKLLQDRGLLEKYRESQNREKKLLSRIEELELKNRSFQRSKSPVTNQAKEKLKEEFRNATQGLTATEWNSKALALREGGKYTPPDRAIEYLNQAINLDHNYTAAYNNRGIAWDDKGDYDQAIKDYSRAIELNPKDAEAYSNRGNAWCNKGDYDRAIKDYNRAIELNPKLAEAYSNRGTVWEVKGDYDHAINDYNRAIELNPKLAEAYYNRGIAWDDKGDSDRAISDYNRAIELNPKYAVAYYNRGNAWYNKGDYDRAINDFNRAIELNPKHAVAYNNRGNAWDDKGDYDQAIKDYGRAIELNPKYADAYYNRGITWHYKGDYDRAINDYNSAIVLNPKYAVVYYNRGVAYEKSGQKGKAASDYNDYLRIRGNKDGDASKVRQGIRDLGYTPKY